MIDIYWQPLVEEVAAKIGKASTIIYVDCKKSAIDLTTAFNQHTDIKMAAYTGEDTSKADKKSVLMNWSADEITLIVAISGFSLGINKPYVRSMCHIPWSARQFGIMDAKGWKRRQRWKQQCWYVLLLAMTSTILYMCVPVIHSERVTLTIILFQQQSCMTPTSRSLTST